MWRKTTLGPLEALLFLGTMLSSVYFLTTPHYYLAILPGLGLLFILLLACRPHIPFFLTLFLIPFQQYTALTDSYRFLTIPKVVGILLILWVAFALLLKKIDIAEFRSRLWPVLIVFFLISTFSTMLSDYPLPAMDNLRRLLNQYAFFGMALYFLSRRHFQKTLPAVLVASISASSFLSILGYLFDISLFAMNVDSNTIKRAVGAANDPNFFAFMIIFALPVMVHLFFSSVRFGAKILMTGLIFLNISAVILTYSRSGAMLLVMVMVLIGLDHVKKLKPIFAGICVTFLLGAVLLGAAVVPDAYWERQKSVTNVKTDRSIGRRMSYLLVAWPSFLDRPILGSGPGAFRELYQLSAYARQFGREGKTNKRAAHNAYLEVAVGTGLLGASAFLLLVGLAMSNFRRAQRNFISRKAEEMAALTRTYRTSFTAILLGMLFLSAVYHKYVWLALALSQAALTISQHRPEGSGEDLP